MAEGTNLILQRIAFGVAFAVGAIDVASAQHSPAPVIELTADGDIQIAPDGHVTDYQLKSKLAPAVAELVDRAVRGWHFEPIVVDGKAVPAKTTMSLHLHGDPAPGDTYSLSISSVHFGVLTRSKLTPPKYPDDAQRVGLGARVVLYIVIDPSGQVVQAMPGQTSLDHRARSEPEAERWRRQFEKVSVEAALQWRYEPSEIFDGKPARARYAIAPIEFNLYDRSGKPITPDWHAYLPGPVHSAPWANPGSDGKGDDTQRFANLSNGETESVDSQFRLKDNVIGKAL
jgi:hypothetical protein